ncbi:chorismate mutase [Clostridium folliculivorans]|uniref:Bifunctional chorismate mutase/prephenate dehydratase n=1 Tax=Clostridium folliculivorans TaxID=2886038 RepID=A0A9W5Y2G8_9CLOT|nr:chorismate mutase [Clostridium folliculivorans]GKU25509.1 chorismate mutase [Clostridium folliculivorans]GKU28532.1 chorismate mutase [Clostridium folliculivorans]
MSDIEQYRKSIDDIDKKIIELFQERMEVVTKVARYKKENNLPIYNGNREEQVIEKNVSRIGDDSLKPFAREFILSMMDISKKYQSVELSKDGASSEYSNEEESFYKQKDLRLGYQGVNGSYSEEALLSYFGNKHKTSNYERFEDVFRALDKDEIDFGVLPIENSSTGAVKEVYDLLRKYGFFIVAEKCIKIEHHLLGIEGAKEEDLREIYSHPQGFEQCSVYLNNLKDVKSIPYFNTAISAEHVSKEGTKEKGAIASKRAADIFNLSVIKEEISNEEDNFTRFIIVGKNIINNASNNKISVVFAVENKAGALFNALKWFSVNNLNMIKIESRPIAKEPWKYFFYIDFEGNIKDIVVKDLLEVFEKSSSYFKLLGVYRRELDVCN